MRLSSHTRNIMEAGTTTYLCRGMKNTRDSTTQARAMGRIKPIWITIMLVFLSISTTTCASELQMRTSINLQQTTLWQLIEALIEHPSYTLDTIGQVLPIEFSERGDNGYSSFHEGGPFRLLDQVVVKKATLAIRHASGESRLIGLDLDPSGTCVTLDDVHVYYPNTRIIGTPRGHSLDEETFWAVRYSWGRVAFGFKEANRRCLASVGIRRNEPSS